MPNITEMELQSLRELVGEAMLGARKCSTYAEQCQDAQLRQMLQSEAQKCQQKAQRLMGFLQ